MLGEKHVFTSPAQNGDSELAVLKKAMLLVHIQSSLATKRAEKNKWVTKIDF